VKKNSKPFAARRGINAFAQSLPDLASPAEAGFAKAETGRHSSGTAQRH